MSDGVDHPEHYGGADDPYKAIKVIEAWELNFSLGSAVKYVSRHGKKAGEAAPKDLRKAAWYLLREAKRLEKEAEVDGRGDSGGRLSIHVESGPPYSPRL